MTDRHAKDDDGNVTLDSKDDDWEWRRKIRANPHSHRIYRIVVGVVGLIVTAAGLVMVPFPGPGWLVVFLGIGIWATEFEWAQRLLRRGKSLFQAWSDWMKVQPWWTQALVGLVTLLAVAAIFWVLFKLFGVPGFFPDGIESFLTTNFAL